MGIASHAGGHLLASKDVAQGATHVSNVSTKQLGGG